MNKIVWVCLYMHRNLWKDSKEESNTCCAGKEREWLRHRNQRLFTVQEFCNSWILYPIQLYSKLHSNTKVYWKVFWRKKGLVFFLLGTPITIYVKFSQLILLEVLPIVEFSCNS